MDNFVYPSGVGQIIRIGIFKAADVVESMVADAVSALLTVMLKGQPGCAYNAANPSTYCSVREMAEMVAALAPDGGVQVRCEIDPDAPYPPEHHLPLDVSRLEALGWAPTQDLPGMYRNLMAYLED